MITIEQNVNEVIIESLQTIDIEISDQQGIPAGGLAGQFLRKESDNHYHVGWTAGTSSYYTHNQLSEAAEWIINHNLGRYPVVSVLSVGMVEQIAEIVHLSINQVRIYFAQPFKGLAQCV